MKQADKNRVAIYVRVSTTQQIDKDSLPMQKKDLIAYSALMLKTDDYTIFEDAGYSGKNTDRPQFQKMMSQIRAGAFSHVLVWKIDRISRNLLDFATMYSELKMLGVTFVSKSEQFDTSTAMGEAMLKIILVFAELERNMTSERVTATMISRAAAGQWNGGRIPYGYDYDGNDFTINEDEASTVRIIHDQYEEIRSTVILSRHLNSLGLETRAGNEWNPVSVDIILRSVFYCGDYRYNVLYEALKKKKDPSEWIVVKDHHPAIVSREQKERVLSIMEQNARNNKLRHKYTATKSIHIFHGLIVCGNCGKVMRAMASNRDRSWQYSKYSCHTNRKSPIDYGCKGTSDATVGEFVINYILNMMNAQRYFTKDSTPDDLEKQLLFGDTFRAIAHVGADGLNDLFDVLYSGKAEAVLYGKPGKMKAKKDTSELNTLRNRRQKTERAIERLTKLYLYDDKALSEAEYIIQREKLSDELDEINAQIGAISSGGIDQSISDDQFVARASEFVIAQRLTDRKYVNYRRLSESVDPKILQAFMHNIIDNVVMDRGRVSKIVFRNGLVQDFEYHIKQ